MFISIFQKNDIINLNIFPILHIKMDGYVIKYGGYGLSFLFNHVSNTTISFDYLDPLTTVVKLYMIGYKKIGTKIGINNHILTIQEPYLLQGLQRYFYGDDRNQLYQLRWPLSYFHGVILGYIEETSCQKFNKFYKRLEEKVVFGLKRLKMTYETANETGSMTENCIDNYIQFLTGNYTIEEYNRLTVDVLTPTIMTVYQEYMKKWTPEDISIIEQLLQSIEKRNDKKTQSNLCDTVESYLLAKNREMSLIRPI